MVAGRRILVSGLVQGVGFRPFLHRIAREHHILGRVRNRNNGVELVIEGTAESIEAFARALVTEAPPLARVTGVESAASSPEGFTDFRIVPSESDSREVTRVAPDTAVCGDCLDDMYGRNNGQERRRQYPFTNCTNCGPRFSIIKSLPYDRPGTTMAGFMMCDPCRHEYEDIENRRYHAQPNACGICGPRYAFYDPGNEGDPDFDDADDTGDPVRIAAGHIDSGEVVAIKGIGGYHLCCDARNQPAVETLRSNKRREGKPFAVMIRNREVASSVLRMSPGDVDLMTSPRAPIVIVRYSGGGNIAPSVTVGLDSIAVMLPYAPIHHVLFDFLETDIIVMTSGNLSDEPIAITNEDALRRLLPISRGILLHNRDIHNRVDDSITTVIRNVPRILRRARGYVPEPIAFDTEIEGIAAFGGELKHVFCIGKGKEAILSQHIGDLKSSENLAFFEESYHRLCELFRFTPEVVACDLHTDYLSTRFARELIDTAESAPSLIEVQHHHAHIASVLAEYNHHDPVIGVAFDGTGLGDDGNIWGGEMLIATRREYSRYAHLDYIPLPGGDAAVTAPWRIAASLLYSVFGDSMSDGSFSGSERAELPLLTSMISRRINTPLSSGAGRLFDGIAALCGLARTRLYDAEGPMLLEASLESGWQNEAPYPMEITDQVCHDGSRIITWDETVRSVMADIEQSRGVSHIAARFHRGLGDVVLRACRDIRNRDGIRDVALSGGVFQNRRLSEYIETILEDAGFRVLVPTLVPANDGGLSLGQLAVAAALREE